MVCEMTDGRHVHRPAPSARYRQLQDAITVARSTGGNAIWTGHPMWNWAKERNAHLDTLQAILDRHRPDGMASDWCEACDPDSLGEWPCPDVLTVETALRNMGAIA